MSRSARAWSSIASNWPTVTARERRVLGVGGEDPRVVGVAGADPARAASTRALRAAGTAVPSSTSRICRSSACCVRSAHVLLAPLDALREPRVAGQRELRVARRAARARRPSRRARRPGRRAPAASSAARGARRPCRSRRPRSRASREPCAGTVDRVAQLAAGALAERAVVAPELALGRARRRATVPVRAPVARAGLAAARRRRSSRRAPPSRAARRSRRGRALVAELERAAVDSAPVSARLKSPAFGGVVHAHG